MNTSTEALRASSRTGAEEQRLVEDAIEAIYRSEGARFRSLAAAVAGADAACDVVQDAFALALRKRGTWRREGPLEAWLWQLVLNAARDAERRRNRRDRLALRLLRLFESGAGPDAAVDGLRGPLRRLPERQRTCVVLRYYGDLSYSEIASVMGIETGTVGALLSKAHAALRAEMEREEQK